MNRVPWYLLAPPAAAIIGGAITTWIAFASADGLVAEDYYKQGLAINKVLAREEAARTLRLSAKLEVRQGLISIRLDGAAPEALFVHLVHATRPGEDQRLRLTPRADGHYEAELAPLAPGRWRAVIEDPRSTWRLVEALG